MNEMNLKQTRINKDLPIPYYYQIVEALRESIADLEEPDVNEKIALPSEPELCGIFSVNRGTIRHALQVLEREGLIYREKGRGTFVQRRRVEMDLSHLCSTTEDIKRRGWTPGTHVISVDKIIPRSHIRESLMLAEKDHVWDVYRCRSANGEPISLQRAFFPVMIMPDLDKKKLDGSLYHIWRDEYQIQPQEGEQTIRTRLALDEEARLLEIDNKIPVFQITRVTYDLNGTPFEYLISVWRGDRYDFSVRLTNR